MSWESELWVESEDLERPGVVDCYRNGLRAFVAEPTALLVLALISLGLGLATWNAIVHGGVLALLGMALGVAVAIPVAWSFDYACLRAVRGQPIRKRDVRRFKRRYPDLVVAGAVVSACVVGGLFLMVVPGVVLYCRLRFVPYLIIDEDLSAGAALRESLDLTRGHVVPVFWISGIGLLGVLAGLPMLLVGAALADAVARLATADFYHASVVPSLEVSPEPLFSELAL